MTESTQDLIPGTQFSRSNVRGCMAADCAVIAVAVAYVVVLGADNIASWHGNRVLIDAGGTGALFAALWVLCGPWSIASNVMLYGWPYGRLGRRARPGPRTP